MSAFLPLVLHAPGLLLVKSHNLEISEWQGVGMFSFRLSGDEVGSVLRTRGAQHTLVV